MNNKIWEKNGLKCDSFKIDDFVIATQVDL